MRAAAVSKLKASLSKYLKRVKAGEEVLVTEHGKPIARLVPIEHTEMIPENLRELEKKGLVKIGSGKLPEDFWAMPRPSDPKGAALRVLLKEREEGC
ncbi:MAG: type II toxin-antitoxin system prevent-host-death family antitoxin [Actinomycetota bacterium]|nr:type II toxin-antitoxin system prevent-host-death family antitoxin [Actinomycetota bacterium]